MSITPQVRYVQGALSDADRTAVSALVARAEAVDGVAPLSEQFRLALADAGDGVSGGRHLLSAHGYAGIVISPSGETAVETVVDPEHRRGGEGAALIAAAVERVRATGAGAPQLWAHGDLPAAAALAARLGLRRVRELLQLRRPLGPEQALPDIPERTDIAVRTYAGPADDAELLRVNNAAFSWHPEQGGWTQQQLDERTGADWFDPAGLFLAFDADPAGSGRLLGFHWTKVHPAGEKGPAALGEVYVVGVDPAAQGRGLGALLTLTGLHHLAAAGLGEVELYVEGDNTAALNTYTRLGFTRYAIDVAYR